MTLLTLFYFYFQILHFIFNLFFIASLTTSYSIILIIFLAFDLASLTIITTTYLKNLIFTAILITLI